MRHGPAEDFSSSGRDFDRSLTPQGRERVKLVAARLAELDEVPKVIEIREELPLTAVGKVDKKVLKAGFWAGRDRMVG